MSRNEACIHCGRYMRYPTESGFCPTCFDEWMAAAQAEEAEEVVDLHELEAHAEVLRGRRLPDG